MEGNNIITKSRINGEQKRNIQNEELRKVYSEWIEQIKKLEKSDGIDFFSDQFSNPHLIEIPSGWFDANTRIMFVGEELNGYWGKDWQAPWKPIELNVDKLMSIYRSCLCKQIKEIKNCSNNYINYGYRIYRSNFWKTIRAFAGDKNTSIIWNNVDKFCKPNDNKKQHKLNDSERNILHKNCTLLEKEIEITRPTHIVFLGWYTESLKNLLGADLCNKPKETHYNKKKIFTNEDINWTLPYEIKSCCFSFHPSSMNRTFGMNFDTYTEELRKCLNLPTSKE